MAQQSEGRAVGETMSMSPVAPSEPPPKYEEDALIGQIIDRRYQIDSRLGEGGMGVVYRVSHVTLGKALAMKVLRPAVSRNEEIVARFKQEAQSASAIGNQHIIDIIDFGSLADGSTYFVMEFLGGQTLTDAATAERFTPQRAIHVAKQLCRALGAAHKRGIVHRDLKPDNVQLIERGGSCDFVKVLDFGIAKVGGSTRNLTQAGQVFGTPHYMSPEQCAGSDVDRRTDVYAMGVILYELCVGRVPFDAETLMGILTKHLYEPLVPPGEVPECSPLPEGLETVITRCLAKSITERYQTMEEVYADLVAVERGARLPSFAPPPMVRTTGPRAPSASRPKAKATPVAGGRWYERAAEWSRWNRIPPRLRPRVALIGTGSLVFLFGLVVLLLIRAPSNDVLGAPGKPATDSAGSAQLRESKPVKVAGEFHQAPSSKQNQQATTDKLRRIEGPAAARQVDHHSSVRLSSLPRAVEVYGGAALLGVTPLATFRPKGQKTVRLTLKKAGYRDKEVLIRALSPDRLAVSLDKIRPAKKSRSRRAVARRRRQRKREARRAKKVASTKSSARAPAPPEAKLSKEVINPWDE